MFAQQYDHSFNDLFNQYVNMETSAVDGKDSALSDFDQLFPLDSLSSDCGDLPPTVSTPKCHQSPQPWSNEWSLQDDGAAADPFAFHDTVHPSAISDVNLNNFEVPPRPTATRGLSTSPSTPPATPRRKPTQSALITPKSIRHRSPNERRSHLRKQSFSPSLMRSSNLSKARMAYPEAWAQRLQNFSLHGSEDRLPLSPPPSDVLIQHENMPTEQIMNQHRDSAEMPPQYDARLYQQSPSVSMPSPNIAMSARQQQHYIAQPSSSSLTNSSPSSADDMFSSSHSSDPHSLSSWQSDTLHASSLSFTPDLQSQDSQWWSPMPSRVAQQQAAYLTSPTPVRTMQSVGNQNDMMQGGLMIQFNPSYDVSADHSFSSSNMLPATPQKFDTSFTTSQVHNISRSPSLSPKAGTSPRDTRNVSISKPTHSRTHSRKLSGQSMNAPKPAKASGSSSRGSNKSVSVSFVNFTAHDSKKILTGVAPSGSSKTKARREQEARDRRRKLSEAALRAVRSAGGDVEALEAVLFPYTESTKPNSTFLFPFLRKETCDRQDSACPVSKFVPLFFLSSSPIWKYPNNWGFRVLVVAYPTSSNTRKTFVKMSGRGYGDLPIRGGRGGGDRGGSRGRGEGGSSGRGSDRGYSGDRGRGSDRGGGRGGRGGSEPPSGMLTDPVEAPSVRVQALEDKYVTESAKARPESNILARRPGYGTQGRPTVLRANFFPMEFKPNIKFHSYRLKIKPEAKKGQQKFILESMFRKYPLFNKGIGVATDGATEIVTTERLPENREPFHCSMGDGSGTSKAYTGPWEATLALENAYSPAEMLACLEDVNHREELPNEAPSLRVLNILMSAYAYKDSGVAIIGKGRNKFFRIDNRKQSMDIKGGLEAIRGYYSSVRLGAGRIFLNLNVSHGAFFRPCLLTEIIDDFAVVHGTNEDFLHRVLKGLKVHVLHLNSRENGSGLKEKPIKTIFGVKHKAASAENVAFWMGDERKGQYVTVAEYFARQYNRPLDRPVKMPVVNVGTPDRPVYLPAELCEVLPGQPCTAELGLIQRQNMIKFSCRRSPQNYDSIMTEGLKLMGISEGHTKAVGIKPGKEMITVAARILNPPNLLYGGKKTTNPRNGSWNLVNTRFSQCASISKWTVLWIRKRGLPKQDVSPIPMLDGFYRKMRDHGLTLPPFDKPHREVLLGKDDRENRSLLKDMFKDLANKSYPVLVIVLPTTEGKIFDYVKYAGDLRTGILTHCMLYDKVMKSNEQYWSNNAMKINLRMGGCNQLLQPANARFIGAGKSTMVVGLDVTHPSSADPDVFPSVASIVASTDYRMGQWPGEVRAQVRRQEHVEFLKEMMLGRLNLWQRSNNGNLPQNILVYRDGVSEGQYNMVLTEELPKIQAAAKAVYRGAMPNITIVVCGKRHNVRFYPTNARDQDRTSNPLNGCVVDRGVTRPMYWDFYLQAQAPLQGSARPAHYIVIHDEIFTNSKANPDRKPVDVLQEVTHNISYMMGRATRSISYSTPAFLADKFCDRGRKYLLAFYHENNQQVRDTEKFSGDTLSISRHCPNSMVYI
ncbi:unnamed protein product [Penicillium nalgiovense]|nr:unnamed protein product [Penicillium nalgiovense]